ncbi:hypothetical protein SD78_2836 [Bacillus badius]|nr:hypothetical protein SD78_2836 [Bacillus badius]
MNLRAFCLKQTENSGRLHRFLIKGCAAPYERLSLLMIESGTK